MKKCLLIPLAFAVGVVVVNAQQLFFTRSAHVEFFSSTPVEDIRATNEKVTTVVNTSTGDIEFSILNMAFQFEKALMQEHFNENYMESAKYPKSTFKGKVTNINAVNFEKDGEYPVDVAGDLTIHGVTRPLETTAAIIVKEGKFSARSSFKIKPEDFKITIPNIVRNNIAKEIKVTVVGNYEPLNK